MVILNSLVFHNSAVSFAFAIISLMSTDWIAVMSPRFVRGRGRPSLLISLIHGHTHPHP
jgi:hypothetical protein